MKIRILNFVLLLTLLTMGNIDDLNHNVSLKLDTLYLISLSLYTQTLCIMFTDNH